MGWRILALSLATWPLACTSGGAPASSAGGAEVTVTVAASTFAGVGDAVWDLRVLDVGGGIVVAERLTSARFGDGQGSATFVGPCDASEGANPNRVELTLVGLYAGPVSSAGGYGAPAPPGALPARMPEPMHRTVQCSANEDRAARFDVTVLRPAGQGFVDLAVSFNDVHCSAKYDCGAGELLFDGDGERGTTHVLGVVCASAGSAVAPTLYLDTIHLDCGAAGEATLDPGLGPDGNKGAVAIGSSHGLFGWAIFRGQETAGGVHRTYWNVALGVDDLSGCTVRTRATADRGGDTLVEGVFDYAIPGSAVYPYIAWEVGLDTCAGNLGLDGVVDGPVSTTYTAFGDDDLAFARRFPLACGPGEPGCPVASCSELLLLDPSASDGVYVLDLDGDGPEPPFEAYCDMTTDGGGWTLLSVHSDDGDANWTWNARTLLTTDRTTLGDVHELHRDYKSLAHHDLPFEDLLFVHNPSGEWAAYHQVGDGSASLAETIDDTPLFNCEPRSGHRLSTGTLTPLTGALCNLDLYFNIADFDGAGINQCLNLTRDHNAATVGAAWSVSQNQGCPFDDPGQVSGLGPERHNPAVEPAQAKGFGWALGLNTGASGAAQNYVHVYARAPIGCVTSDDCPAGHCLEGACRAVVRSCREWRDLGETADGVYAIDPRGTGAFETYCDMTTDGGGWTLVSTHSDDGQATWTWNQRDLFTTNRATIGTVAERHRDYKNLAMHDLPFRDLLFVHAPSGQWASYHAVSTHGRSLAEHLAGLEPPLCNTGQGHPMTAGTISAAGTDLCSTDLYFHLGDYDGANPINCTASNDFNNIAYGPAWSIDNNNGCVFDDPGIYSGLGPDFSGPNVERPQAKAFGFALGLNTGQAGAAANYVQVFVREGRSPSCAADADCEPGLCVDGVCEVHDVLTAGTGADGDLTVSGTQNFNTPRTTVASVAADKRSITVANASGFARGDEVMLHTVQAAVTNRAGVFEMARVRSVQGSTLHLAAPLGGLYVVPTDRVVAQRVPNYRDVTVNAGATLTTAQWNGTVGGVIAFRAAGVVTVAAGGAINVDGRGFRRGVRGERNSSERDGQQGESYVTTAQQRSGSPLAGAGGGGRYACSGGGDVGSGGGGGGYGVAGADGLVWTTTGAPGQGGLVHGDSVLGTLFLGSGGGGGAADYSNSSTCGHTDAARGGFGGHGGGAIVISAAHVVFLGQLSARGSDGTSALAEGMGEGGGGGGGAGGAVLVYAGTTNSASLPANVSGGAGGQGSGNDSNTSARRGGPGGAGRVKLLPLPY